MGLQRGTERFQWNVGGWFGCQIGSTIWLLLAGILLTAESVACSALLFGCFLIPTFPIWMPVTTTGTLLSIVETHTDEFKTGFAASVRVQSLGWL